MTTKLLLPQVSDKVIRENFLRIQNDLKKLEDMINNIEITPVDGGEEPVTEVAEVATQQLDDFYMRFQGSRVGSVKQFLWFLNQRDTVRGQGEITRIASTTDGDKFVVNESGIYTIAVSFGAQTSTAQTKLIAITKNLDVTGNPYTDPNFFTHHFLENSDYPVQSIMGNVHNQVTWTGYLAEGEYFKIANYYPYAPVTGWNEFSGITITKQQSIKQVRVTDETVEIPTSYLRFEGASAKGSVDTAIVQFTNISKIKGSGLSYISNSSNGTVVRAERAGELKIFCSLGTTAIGSYFITKNQTVLTTTPTSAGNNGELLTVNTTSAGNYFPASVVTEVEVGDVIRITSMGTVSAVYASLNITLQEKNIAVSVSNSLPTFSDSDLVVKAAGNASQVVGVNAAISFTTISDSTGGSWTGSQFTVTEAGTYTFTGSIYFTTSAYRQPKMYVDGAQYRYIGSPNAYSFFPFSITDYFNEGQVIFIAVDGTGGTLNNASAVHWLNITKTGKPNVTGNNITNFVDIPFPAQYATVDAGAITITGSVSNPTKGASIVVDKCTYVRRGDRAIIQYQYNQISASSTSGSGQYYFAMPAGLTIDTTKFTIGHQTSSVCGSGWLTTNGDGRDVVAFAVDATKFSLGYANGSNTSITATTHGMAATAFFSFSFQVDVPIQGWSVTENVIVTEVETFNSDTDAFTYCSSALYNISTLANAPKGSYITYTVAAGGNVKTQTTIRPTQTDAEINSNGFLIYGRAYNVTSTAANPAIVAIQIGKNLKGWQLAAFKTAGKLNEVNTSYWTGVSAGYEYGLNTHYNPNTGILYIDGGLCNHTTTTSRGVGIEYLNSFVGVTSCYLTINASKNPAMAGVNTKKDVVVIAYKTVAQGLINGASTTLTWDASGEVDTHGTFNPATGIFTCPQGQHGWYVVDCNLLLDSVAYSTSQSFDIYVEVNGISLSARQRIHGNGAAAYHSLHVNDLVYLAAGDTLRVGIYHGTGATRNTYPASGWNKLKIFKK
jgi:hypothetical protein